MPTEFYMYMAIAGVVGLVLGFLISYLYSRRRDDSERRELTVIRGRLQERESELDSLRERNSLLERKIDQRDSQIASTREEIAALQRSLDDKEARERRAVETLRGVFDESREEGIADREERISEREEEPARGEFGSRRERK
jgi:septal ring factor EnvC (AmiA/AmiB activator)